jgi:hypothetical protein
VKQWLLFAPLVRPSDDKIVGLAVVGHVRAVDAEHAIRVAKTKGFPAPMVGEKHAYETGGTVEGRKSFVSARADRAFLASPDVHG